MKYWQHNDGQRRWELWLDDMAYEPRLLGYVNDEFIWAAAVGRGSLERYLEERFGTPLPQAAFDAMEGL